jgi:hypothetical protein
MAAINPKLEFYRFKLNHRQEDFKTFRDFALEELSARKNWNNEKIMGTLFLHFKNSLNGKNAKDDKLKKQIKLETRRSVNKYLDNQPKYITEDSIICGVINGGPYGRDRIIGDINNPEEGSQLSKTKSVLQYYFILLYLPLDHNEGCFIIHSNGKEETITNIFRRFISNMFKATDYNKTSMNSFCPKSFQEEFRKGAIIQSIEFKDTEVDDIHTVNATSENMGKFDVKIEIIPRNKEISVSLGESIKSSLNSFFFGKEQKHKNLNEFDNANLITKNPVDNSTRTFEWNSKDNDFVPVVWLNGRISKLNEDDTPDFDELEKLCINYLKDEVLPDLRPDLNVTKAK